MITVATSGYFNPIHKGHLELLRKAKGLGDKLVVIVNNDKQVELKGGKFMDEKERLEIVKSIKWVDEAVLSIDTDRTVIKTLNMIKPDIFAKGGDSTVENVPENGEFNVVYGLGKKVQSSSSLKKGKSPRVLVTGHKGFIGSRLFKELDAVGIDVREGYNLLSCELPKDIDIIYHLAAQSDVVASWFDPLQDLDNIRITARLVKEYPNAKIIYANSCASLDRSSPYGFSKWASGEYLKCFHKNYVSCIFPNIYGDGSRSVVDIFKGKDNVTVYGDGKQTRDYVHVNDIIEGLLKAQKWETGVYLMGSGKSIPVLELAKGKKITFAPERKEAREVVVPNTTPDWEPQIDVFKYMEV